MKKLALDLDRLAVESFATTPRTAAARGTVRGHGLTETGCPTVFDETCNPDICNPDTAECTLAACLTNGISCAGC